jgi:protein-L-isoaspartate(D-aspartate) O-methyltransferase
MTPVEAARRRGVRASLLAALGRVDRAPFLEEPAAGDVPGAIGGGHHSPEPSVCAWLCELAGVRPGVRVLELGAGTGYLSALAEAVGADVTGVERDDVLRARAAELVPRAAFAATRPEGRWDAIVVSTALLHVPDALLDALAPGGTLVAPVGRERQEVVTLQSDAEGRLTRRSHGACAFEPTHPTGYGGAVRSR